MDIKKQIQDILLKMQLELTNQSDISSQNQQNLFHSALDKFAGTKYEIMIIQADNQNQQIYSKFFDKTNQKQISDCHVKFVPNVVKNIQIDNNIIYQFEHPSQTLKEIAQQSNLFFEKAVHIFQEFTFSSYEILNKGFYFSILDFDSVRVRNDQSIYIYPFQVININEISLDFQKQNYINFVQGIINILERQTIQIESTKFLNQDLMSFFNDIIQIAKSSDSDFLSTLLQIQKKLNTYVSKRQQEIIYEINMLREEDQLNRLVLLQQILVQIDPCEYLNQFDLGVTYKKLNKIDQALKYLKKSVQINSSFDQGYLEIGVIYLYELMDIDSAQQYFEFAIENNSQNADAYFNLGYCYLNKGKSDKSIPLYKQCLQINNKHAQALLDLGWQNYLLGNLEQALYYYAQSFEADKTIDSTLLNTINCLHILSRQEEAQYFIEQISSLDGLVKYTQRLIVLDPLNYFLYHDLGIIYLLIGENNRALISFKKCLEVKPDYIYKDFLNKQIKNLQITTQ